MLQQTQVATVLPYYRRFMYRFPDLVSLAEASEDEVLGLWSGLGYYRRARNLHAAARLAVTRHDGCLPDDRRELMALPGVGRYTAGAITSMAFGLEEPVLDGNVRRVLSRLTADSGRSQSALWAIARTLVRGRDPGDLNQALMELGALVCTPRAPRCSSCPVRSACEASRLGRPESFPEPRPARATETVRVAVAVARRGGRVLLERPGRASPFRGTWDLPAREIAAEEDAGHRIRTQMQDRYGLILEVGPPLGRARHAILHRRLDLEPFDCRLVRGRPSDRRDLRWVRPGNLGGVPVSGATTKLFRMI